MKIQAFLRGGAAFIAVFAALSAVSMVSFAEESDTTESEAEIKTYTSSDGDYVYSILMRASDETERAAKIEKYSGRDTEITIPTEIDGLTVVALGDNAYASRVNATKFTIPETVTELGVYTFVGCPSVTEYVVAEDNPYFEAKDGVLYGDEGQSLLRYPVGKKPTEYTIPEDVLSIGHGAFAECSSLTSVTFHENLEHIGKAAFADCTGLTEVVIPEKITEISDFCFNSCTNLKSVTLPKHLRIIGSAAFSATSLDTVTLPETLTSIGEQAFISTPMTEITIPRSVTDIGFTAIGWDVTHDGMLYSKDDFIVYGYRNTGAQSYTEGFEFENTFKFEALDTDAAIVENNKQNESSTADDAAEEEKSGSLVKIIGISVCGAAILGILAAAAFSGKKKKSGSQETEEADENTESLILDKATENAESEEAEEATESTEPEEETTEDEA